LDGNITGTAFLDEDDMSSDSATSAASQQSIKAHVAAGTVTMTNKTLTSPVINTGVSGTAILDEDDMASDSNTQLATQQSIKAYIDSGSVTFDNVGTFSNKNFSQDGTVTITDTGATASESPLKVFTPNLLASPGTGSLFYGVEEVAKNCAVFNFGYVGDGSASNYLRIRLAGLAGGFYVDGSGNVGIESVSDGDKFYVSGTSEITDTLTLSKASGTGLSVTSDIDFNAIAGGATKAEINTTCDGNTATAAEITARCDGVPNYSTDDNSSPVTVTSGGVQAATLDLGTVTAGDVFFIEAQFTYSKGVSGGKSNYYINQASGTATITFPTTAIATSHDDAANITYNRHFGGMCFVTGSGTLVMQMGAFSDGSDSSIGSGACDLAATFIKKQ
jgi:hypothetical protein